MGLNGTALPIVLGIVAVALLVLIVLGKPRFPHRGASMAARGGMTVLFTAAVLGLVGALLNNEYAFYSSWGDLLGSPPDVTPREYGAAPEAAAAAAASALPAPRGAASPSTLPPLPQPGQRLQKFEIDGPQGGKARRKVFVRLPAGYDPAKKDTYPVILAMHGIPGSPASYDKLGHFYDKVDAAVGAGTMKAPIVIVPQLNPAVDGDTECIDAPGGLQTETWLSRDVPAWAASHFRTASGRGSWSTWGYSFGGWCASMLALKHPDTFGAAVAYQGYFRPQFEGRSPLRPGSDLARSYDLVDVERRAAPAVALWIFASQADPGSYPSTRDFLAAVRAPTSVTSRIGQGGGHRLSVWTRKIPASFEWLGQVQPGFRGSAPTSSSTHSGDTSSTMINAQKG